MATEPDFKIQPVSSNDIPILGEMVYNAKLYLTINRLLWKNWPNELAQRKQYTASVEEAFNASDMEDFKVIDTRTQKVAGYVVMRKVPAPSDEPSAEPQEASDSGVLEEFDPDVYQMVMKAAGEISKDFNGLAHYEIIYIVVDPLYRRKGLGTELEKLCLERAEKENLPIYICSEPEAYDFHVSMGFKEIKHVDMELHKFAPAFAGFGTFRLTGMVWRPGSTNS